MFGNIIGGIGRVLNLPEFGISEKLGGTGIDGRLTAEQNPLKPVTDPATLARIGFGPAVVNSPTDTSGGGGGIDGSSINGTSGSGGAAAGPSPEDLAYWNAQLSQADDQLSRLPNQENVGLKNILDSYLAAFNTLTNQQGRAKRDFDTTRDTTQQDNVKAKAQIDTGVRQQMTALQRLFGSKGAANSSAAQVLGPYAAALQGNEQRADVQDAYGRNMAGIDLGWKDTEEDFKTSFGNLSADKTNRESTLKGGVAGTRAKILSTKQQIAANMGKAPDPAIASELSNLGRQIDGYGAMQTFDPGTVNYKTPDLAQYNYEQSAAPGTDQIQGGRQLGLGAYYTLMGGPEDKKKAALAAATV